jgi:hypothetical protein
MIKHKLKRAKVGKINLPSVTLWNLTSKEIANVYLPFLIPTLELKYTVQHKNKTKSSFIVIDIDKWALKFDSFHII